MLDGIQPWDEAERADVARTREWASSGAPLYRLRKPDVPPVHLVSYFVARDEMRALLLVARCKAGLWLPSGGHVEPGEDPWQTWPGPGGAGPAAPAEQVSIAALTCYSPERVPD